MKRVFPLDAARGAFFGLLGTGAGVGITMLARVGMGLPAWKPGPVLTIGIFVGFFSYLIALGVLGYWARWAMGMPPGEEAPPQRSWRRYFNVDTNHKVIGIQYLITGLTFLPFAVALQLIGRLELSKLINIQPTTYESVISDHGIVMLFIVVLPVFSGIMNYLVPLMVGAKDMAFPRLNALSYWLVPPAGLLVVFSLAAGGFDTGWTAYVPLSSAFAKTGMDLILIGVFISGFSSILTAVNILTTVFKLRAPGMRAFRMPVIVWSALATTGLSLVFTQFIAMSFLMVLLQRLLGMAFFDPTKGGAALLYQYLFWFYSHPAVYVFVLIGLGIISDLVPVFSRKPLFGYRGVAISSPGIALGGTIVFGHHMFAAGIPGWLRIPFMVTTMLVAVPTGVKVFAWVTTMWLGKLRITTAFLFVLSSIIVFLIGGLTGIPIGIVPVDLYLHDTYFVVGHFHATLFGGFLLPTMAAIYFWFPKASGRMMNERLGKTQWLLMTLGAASLILPMLGLGLEGMRRRVETYPANLGYQPLHIATAVGGFLIFTGLVVMVVNIVRSLRRGAPAGNNPWNSRTLEWQVSSPPPEENFIQVPQVIGAPYGYGQDGYEHTTPSETAATG